MIYRFDSKEEGTNLGGKGKGLSMLNFLGFSVPDFMVITPSSIEKFLNEPLKYIEWMSPKPKAIRSSGMKEDGEEYSYAGQYESFLNKKTEDEIVTAVRDCVASAGSNRIKKYDDGKKQIDLSDGIAVIIQDMVDAKYAGVAFSVDPVNHRRDMICINLVEGLADKLVDGKIKPESLLINKYDPDPIFDSQIASPEILTELISGLEKLENEIGKPVDIEWAVDQNDQLFWLQARPITTLSKIHINELDSKLAIEKEILTRANIGEMMPGHLSPLSISTFGKAIEYGIQEFYMECGVQKKIVNKHVYIKYFYNHGFISMTGLYKIADAIILPKNLYIEYSILGRPLGGKSMDPKRSLLVQLNNQRKQFSYLGKAKKRLEILRNLNTSIHQPKNLEKKDLYEWIDCQLHNLNKAYSYHYCTSAKSGSQYSALISVISGGPIPTPESNAIASHFLKNIDGIVGADSIQQLKNIARSIDSQNLNLEEMTDEDLLEEIRSNSKTNKVYLKFLEDHGHRCVREGELKEKDWSQEPIKLIRIIRNIVKSQEFDSPTEVFDIKDAMNNLQKMSGIKKVIVKKLAKSTREAIALREMSKSAAIKFQQKIKFAYIELSKLLVQNGLLNTKEDIFYLKHKEIGQLIQGKMKDSFRHIQERKNLDAIYSKMSFQEVYFGHPFPVKNQIQQKDNKGTIVSQGKVQGKVKVVRTLDDADKLVKGDIMICEYTDIGWSPYFAIIGGIITEIGSPLSHGAVVAREYGIPAIVNMKGAMNKFEDHQEIRIDTTHQDVVQLVKSSNV